MRRIALRFKTDMGGTPAAAGEGRYDEGLWKAWTGKTLQALGDEWLAAQRTRLGVLPDCG